MHYPSVIDADREVLRRFSPGPPVTLFLDTTSKITHVQRGEIKSAAALRALVRDHLGVTVSPRRPTAYRRARDDERDQRVEPPRTDEAPCPA